MHPIKYMWALRALVYKPFFKHIGNMTYIGKPCFIEGRKRISIGKKTRIFPGIRMEAIGTGEISIGDNCAIEQNVHITSAGRLLIGDDVTIVGNVCVTNIDHEYRNIDQSVLEQGYIISQTSIGKGSFIGYGSIIQAGTQLGKHCIVGANSVVKGEYPDYSVIVGIPGKVIKRYNNNDKQWEKANEK